MVEMPRSIGWLTILLLFPACPQQAAVDLGQAAEAWNEAPPLDEPAYREAKRRYDERVRRRNAELVRQLDLEPAAAQRVEDRLSAEHAARLALADQPDSAHGRLLGRRSIGADIRDIVGSEKAEHLDRLRGEADTLKETVSR